jgi:hypothetical protein
MEKLLLGIIIDVSSSMKKNWGNDLKIKQTKIEAVKNALNEEIQRLNTLQSKSEKLDRKLFCLGIGFKLSLNLISVDLSDGGEKKSKDTNTELIGIICDVLALSDLIPSQQKLETIKEAIRSFWDKKASELLSGIKIDENYHLTLEKFIQEGLTKSFRVSIHNYLENSSNIIKNTIGKLFKFIEIPISEPLLKKKASVLSSNYTNEVKKKADEIFDSYKDKYKKIIESQIADFAYREIHKILERNTLGFSVDTILKNFDKNLLENLSENIITEIKSDIDIEFKEIWKKHELEFWTQKFKFLSRLRMKGVSTETENTIKNIGWFNLKPFIEKFVFEIFHKKFEEVSKNMLKEWINMSTHREVTKSINDLTNIFPNTSEKDIYSDDYMFGGTPMLDAVNRAAIRFNNKKFDDYRKILLIITDGEYDNEFHVKRTIDLAKQSGVTIVCGYISNNISIENFKKEVRDKTKKGAQNLMDIASEFEECPELVELINKGEITTKKKNKLCIQVNQPKKLNKILEGIMK